MIPLLQIIEYFRLKIVVAKRRSRFVGECLNRFIKKSYCWSEATALNGQLSIFNCQSCLAYSESKTVQAGGRFARVRFYE